MNPLLDRIKRKLKYRWFLHQEKRGHLTNRELMWRLCDLLDGELVAGLSIQKMREIAILTPYSNLDILTQQLKEINRLIEEERSIPPTHIDVVFKPRFIDEFFTDSKGYYSEITISFNKFRNECIRFLRNTEGSEKQSAGYMEYVSRVLNKNVFLALEILLRSLTQKVFM